MWVSTGRAGRPKTAACVLLFSLGRPALPVDTHIHRVAKRLALIGPKVSAEVAQGLLEDMLAPPEFYPFHMLMIEHGRRLCKALRPLCTRCPLRHGCPTGPAILALAWLLLFPRNIPCL